MVQASLMKMDPKKGPAVLPALNFICEKEDADGSGRTV